MSETYDQVLSIVTYHLTPVDDWRARISNDSYRPEAFGRDGFIHCTDGETLVLEVGNRYYQNDPRPYCLLTIEVARVSAPVRYDDAARVYPHIYGPLNTDAVDSVRTVIRDQDGAFVCIGDRLPIA